MNISSLSGNTFSGVSLYLLIQWLEVGGLTFGTLISRLASEVSGSDPNTVISIVHGVQSMLSERQFRDRVLRVLGVESFQEVLRLYLDGKLGVDYILSKLQEALGGKLEMFRVEVERMVSEGVVPIPFFSTFYPRRLLEYEVRRSGSKLYPPLALYVRLPGGSGLPDLNARAVAVVGTRKCTVWGRRTAGETGSLVARLGFVLVTGLAECIDEAASRAALKAGGVVVGVRPWLKPLSTPRETRDVAEKAVVVAENYRKPRTGSIAKLYYLRNRLIAGLSELVIVVEARPGGGSMHQIEWSIKAGRKLVVFKHPHENTEYYEAYMKYAKYAERGRAMIVENIGELEEHLKKLQAP